MQSIYSKEFKLGVLGGGQLGRMLIQEAINLDVKIYCLDPSANAPCSKIAHGFAVGDFNDYQTVMDFGIDKDLLTIEIEHVNIQALKELEEKGIGVYPQSRIIELVQDKGAQKLFYKAHGIPTSDFVLVENAVKLKNELGADKKVQKLRRGGYDGRGVQVLNGKENIDKVFDQPSVLEDLVDIDKELAVIVARNERGDVVSYPVVDMEFNPVANLVEYLYSPAEISSGTEKKARDLAERLIVQLDMVGLLAVELFLNKEGDLLVNEIAPRPHNSGHHTIEANYTSQYAQHLRAILGLPLGSTSIIKPAAMINLLGQPGYIGPVKYEGLSEVLIIPEVYVHLYGKSETKPFRKMGHVTLLGDNLDELKEKSVLIKQKLKVKA
jgi:5-(carboxyamino)imidazole ribonucleotide synthase